MRRVVLALALLGTAAAPPANRPQPGILRVRLDTSAGPIILALDAKHAPGTTANFMAYVDDGRLDDTAFYRATRGKRDARTGFIQGGIGTDAKRILPPFPFEPTTKTGIRHLDATVSMARGASPDSAGGNFVLTVGPAPAMDARPPALGYAAFGHVIDGMTTVKRILALPTGGGMDEFKNQMILKPVTIVRAIRLDGVAKPTGGPKVWLLLKGVRQ